MSYRKSFRLFGFPSNPMLFISGFVFAKHPLLVLFPPPNDVRRYIMLALHTGIQSLYLCRLSFDRYAKLYPTIYAPYLSIHLIPLSVIVGTLLMCLFAVVGPMAWLREKCIPRVLIYRLCNTYKHTFSLSPLLTPSSFPFRCNWI